jgi:hypothetical protein
LSEQGKKVQYGTDQGIRNRGQITYGIDEVSTLQQQVAALIANGTAFSAHLERSGGPEGWIVLRIAGATLTGQSDGLGFINLTFLLDTPLGFNGRVTSLSSSELGGTNIIGQTIATASNGAGQDGDTVSITLTIFVSDTGAPVGPAEDDFVSIAVYGGEEP